MGILDDAIREHLDLKRRHGARDAELREIEGEALGSSEDQPDPFAAGELFNDVSSGTAEAEPSAPPPEGLGDLGEIGEPAAGGEEPTRLVEPEGLRPTTEPEALQPSTPAPSEPPSEPLSPPEGIEQLPGQTELDEIPGQERLEDPLEGYQPQAETPEPAPEPPARSESLEDLIAEEEPFPEDSAAPSPELHGTEEEELPLDPEAPPPPAEPEAHAEPEPAEEAPEPRSSVPEPPPPPPDTGPEPPGRARGRVDVPTQEHPPPGQTGGLPAIPEQQPEPLDDASPADDPFDDEPAAESGGPQLYDFETDEDPVAPAHGETDDDFEALGPAEEEAPYLEEEEPYAEEPVSETEAAPFEEPGTAVRPALEDDEPYEGGAPDPEEKYEEEGEEGLWFEKGPPQDFDFDE